MTKPFEIPKRWVWEAYRRVKANGGAAGVDQQSLKDFERDWRNHLYKLWNRLASGSYFPQETREVEIPKGSGGYRRLGIPTVSDRIAQMVVKLKLEPALEACFIEDSYGYRPGRSAIDAVAITRQRCWQYNWVVEYDIQGLFDHIPHDLLMRAVRKHTGCRWSRLYIERWLKASTRSRDGQIQARQMGVPQGGVISPLLANLYLHYAIDKWVEREEPSVATCRYADDGVIHCRSKQQAEQVLRKLETRLHQCGLRLHPRKTRIVYCKDGRRKRRYPNTAFTFLGYTFKPRVVSNRRTQHRFVSFTPAVSKEALKTMRERIRRAPWRWQTELSLEAIAQRMNPILRGWLHYYGRFHRSGMDSVWRHFNRTLIKWWRKKYKRYRRSKTRASQKLQQIAAHQPCLFIHWEKGIPGAFA
jgi:group II intron reverse transcriptase/maturase